MALALRNVESKDLGTYIAMRCDPVMMAELGGPLPRDGIEAKVERDVVEAALDTSWILMIVPNEEEPETVAGSVVMWSNTEHGEQISEIGWMVLPAYQGRGLGKASVHMLLQRAREVGRWGIVHAYPGITNEASNGICRTLGFTLLGEEEVLFADRTLRVNHWTINPATDLADS